MVEVSEGLVRAVGAILRPLAERLVSLGVPYGRVEAQLRRLFVEVAARSLATPGRIVTDSSISLVTGINRKEVRRLRRAATPAEIPAAFGLNQAAILISRWQTDPQTRDRSGKPSVLPYRTSRGPSFMKLARRVTGDLAPGVLLSELVRSGAVVVGADQSVRLAADAYVPRTEPAEKLQILAEDPAELIDTVLKNILAETDELLVQRKVSYDNLGADGARRVRAEMRRESERFVRRINRLLARHDRDRNPHAAGGARHTAGVGVYFFETSPPETRRGAKPAARRKPKERTR